MKKLIFFSVLFVVIACKSVMADIDISNISNPNGWKATTHQTTLTIGQDGKTLFYRGKSTGMTLNTPGQPGGKITVKDPSIAPKPKPQPKPQPQPKPNGITAKSVALGAAQVAGGLLLGAEGVDISAAANAPDTKKTTWGDVGSSAAGVAMTVGGAAAVINAIPVGGQVGYGVAVAVGAAIGTLAAGRKMFSETDCESDGVRGVYACCNISNMTNIQAFRAEIGQEMWTDVFPYVRTCLQGGKPFEASWIKGRFLDDAWSVAEKRLCAGVVEPTDATHVLPIGMDPDSDNKNICWDWTCEDGWIKNGSVCVKTNDDNHDGEGDNPNPGNGGGGGSGRVGKCHPSVCVSEVCKACCAKPASEAVWDRTGQICQCVNGGKFEKENNQWVCKVESSTPVVSEYTCDKTLMGKLAGWKVQCAKNTDVLTLITELEAYCAGKPTESVFLRLYDDVQTNVATCGTPVQDNNDTTDTEAELRKAQSKITKSASALKNMSEGFKVSVWKNKEGNFNTARLASDSIAGVVLGTAGGLITSNVVKKNQVKNGFEDIQCTIGGQVVADWGDEFRVGIQ